MTVPVPVRDDAGSYCPRSGQTAPAASFASPVLQNQNITGMVYDPISDELLCQQRIDPIESLGADGDMLMAAFVATWQPTAE